MALKQQIIWTACPNGLGAAGAGTYGLSVHVAPRLSGGANLHLSDFPDFLQWAGNGPTGFSVQFEVGGNAQAPIVATFTDVRDSAIWAALFGASTPIHDRDAQRDYQGHRVRSYPAQHIHDFVRRRQIDAALDDGEELPAYESLIAGPYGDIGYGSGKEQGQNQLAAALRQLASERDEPGVGGRPKRANVFTGASDEKAFAALRDFHAPRSRKRLAEVKIPTIDLQQALSLIGNHPRLMRLLGITFDLNIPAPTLGPGETAVKVRIIPAFAGGGTPDNDNVTPYTLARASASSFEPDTPSAELTDRQLRLGTTAFGVLRVDVDGGGLKSAFFADSLKLSRSVGKAPGQPSNPPAPDAPTQYAQPTVSSAGFAVVHDERALKFVRRIDRSRALKDGLPSSVPDLLCDDIIRGYVLDVFDTTTNAWHSTGRRAGSYHFTGPGAPADVTGVVDEASFDAPPTGPTDPADPDEFHLQQTLVRWDGWSLAGQRPGKALQENGQAAAGIGTDPQFKVEFRLKPQPGTLPLLRYGRKYRLRMRAVDLAGNTVAFAMAAQVGDPGQRVTAEQAYLRHDPVASPDILSIESAAKPGDSLAQIVIRGNYDSDASENAIRSLIPPRTSQAEAEVHGLFDTGGKPDKTKYPLIVAREDKHYAENTLADPAAPVPFLPDVLSRGLCLRPLDGTLAGSQFKGSFAPAAGFQWPDYRPMRLQLEPGGAQAVDVTETDRTVHVKLDKGDEVTMRLSSTMNAADLQLLGLFGWLNEHLSPGSVSAAAQASIADGRYWAFTPFQLVHFVYAVRQPLKAPTLAIVHVRHIGETFTALSGGSEFSRKSTSRMELRATWNDPVDEEGSEPSGPGALLSAGRDTGAVPFQIDLSQDPNGSIVLGDSTVVKGRHEFGDTKHRVVTYAVQATSKFTEYFQGSLQIDAPADETSIVLSAQGVEPDSVTVKNRDTNKDFPKTAFSVDPVAGSITFHDVPPGTKLDIEFLPPVSRSTPGPLPTVNVLSSARPKAPEIVDVVPIFKWGRSKKGSKIQSTRSPSGVRVWMKRPWWTSGVGELLGVLTWADAKVSGTAAIPADVAPYVSDWGADPLFAGSKLTPAHPRASAFAESPASLRSKMPVGIEEKSGVLVDVAGHEVHYDKSRDLWYADVAVNVGKAYTPMIRLAVARYQPDSVAGVELSKVVLLDILQVAPGRLVTVQRKGAKVVESVKLQGYSYTDGPGAVAGPGSARVVIETRDTGFSDKALGWHQHLVKPMSAKKSASGVVTWSCAAFTLPKAKDVRLVIQQFEGWRVDKAKASTGSKPGDRLVHQDIVPLTGPIDITT